MARNSFRHEGFLLCPVEDFSVVTTLSSFSGDDDIDEFLTKDAARHFKDRMAVTYTLTLGESTEILAFAALQNDAIRLRDGLEGYPYRSFPAVKIGRLGVAQNRQRAGFGSLLLFIITQFMLCEHCTGCRFITLDAYNSEKTINFYHKNGFFPLQSPTAPGRRTVAMYKDLLSCIG